MSDSKQNSPERQKTLLKNSSIMSIENNIEIEEVSDPFARNLQRRDSLPLDFTDNSRNKLIQNVNSLIDEESSDEDNASIIF